MLSLEYSRANFRRLYIEVRKIYDKIRMSALWYNIKLKCEFKNMNVENKVGGGERLLKILLLTINKYLAYLFPYLLFIGIRTEGFLT